MSVFPTVAVDVALSYADAVIAHGADSYWRLNDTSGDAVDSVGGITAADQGAPTYSQTGPLSDGSTAIALNGSADYFTAGDVYDFNGTAAFSVEFWINLTSNHATQFVRIVSKETTDGSGTQGWWVGIDPQSQAAPRKVFLVRRLNGAAEEIRSTTQLTLGTYAHVAFTYDGANMRCYVNGVLEGSAVASTLSVINHAQPFTIGRKSDSATAFLAATLSDVAIYDTVLTAAQIAEHYVRRDWVDLAADVLREASITIRHGIQSSQPTDRVAPTGMAMFALNNSERNSASTLGYYSPHHTSVRAGWGLGLECRIRITDPATATTYTRFIGRIDAIDPVPGVNDRRAVLVTVVDWMDEAARWKLTPQIGEQVNADWAAVTTAIIAQMPFSPTSTSFQGGSESYPYVLDSSAIAKQTVLSEFRKLAGSEYGLIYVKADGTLRLEDRHYRMTTTASVWTLTDAEYQGLELPSTRDDIINTVRTTTHKKRVDPTANVTVYDQDTVVEFAAGATKTWIGSYRDQVTGAPIGATSIAAQVSGVDYTANTLESGAGADVSSSFTITVTKGQSGAHFSVTNGTGATAYLTTNRLVGKGIYDYGAMVHEATDATSIGDHGEHAVDFDMPYQSRQDVGQAASEYILAKFKDPLAQARTVSVVGRTAALLTQILTREVSDRLTLSETVTGVADDFFIQGMELTVMPEGCIGARYVLSPTHDPATGAYFVIDTSALDGPDILAPF